MHPTSPNIVAKMARRLVPRPPRHPKIFKNLKENLKFLIFHPCPRMPPKSSPKPPKTLTKYPNLDPRCSQDLPNSAQDPHLEPMMARLSLTTKALKGLAWISLEEVLLQVAPKTPSTPFFELRLWATIFLDFRPLWTTIFPDFRTPWAAIFLVFGYI